MLRRPFPQTLSAVGGGSGSRPQTPGPPAVPRLDGVPDLPALLHIAREVAAGLVFLHAKSITHSDVKSLNVLLVPSSTYPYVSAKLADMGTAEFLGVGKHQVVNATRMYLSPEVIETGILTTENDVHAFGIVLWEILHANWMRWQSLGENYEYLRRIHIPIPAQLAFLIASCTDPLPEMRPRMDTVLRSIMDIQNEFQMAPGQANFREFTGKEYTRLAQTYPFASGYLSALTLCSFGDIHNWVSQYYDQYEILKRNLQAQQLAAAAEAAAMLATVREHS